MGFVQIVLYLSLLFFLVAIIVRAVKYASAPVHMRWELYPVAHERGRAEYGGSIFEESEWWTKPRDVDHINELKEMAEEIFLLKGVRRNNPKLWLWSLPFHFGLYLMIIMMIMLAVGAILALAGVDPTGIWPALVRTVTTMTGFAGLALILIGAMGLFFRRLNAPELRKFNAPSDYFNLLIFALAAGWGLFVHLTGDIDFSRLQAFTTNLVGFRAATTPGPAMAVELTLAALLFAYMPVTRMFHFVAKYFLYHDVRWSDDPNRRGSRLEARLKQALDYGVSWQGPHIQTGESWGKVATEDKQ